MSRCAAEGGAARITEIVGAVPAFVPLSILPEPVAASAFPPSTEAATGSGGVMTIEVGPDGRRFVTR